MAQELMVQLQERNQPAGQHDEGNGILKTGTLKGEEEKGGRMARKV